MVIQSIHPSMARSADHHTTHTIRRSAPQATLYMQDSAADSVQLGQSRSSKHEFLTLAGLAGGVGLAALAMPSLAEAANPAGLVSVAGANTGNLFIGIIFAAGIAGTALAVYMAAKSAQQPPCD